MSDEAGELSAKSPFGAAAQVVIRGLSDKMIANLAGAARGEDIEAVHDMRVASRRLRAALRVFRACFPKSELQTVAQRVGAVTQALGHVRDQDVFLEYLVKFAASTPEAAVGWIVDRENQIREGARVQMLDSLGALERQDFPALMSSLLSHASMTTISGKRGSDNAYASQAPKMIKARLGEINDLAPAIDDPANVLELHQMRIAAKRLRYTMETFLPCFGRELADEITPVKLLQEQLGQIHDCDVWIDKLQSYQNQPGLSEERVDVLKMLVQDRSALRVATYHQAVDHWHELTELHFSERLMKLVGSASAETRSGKSSVPGETISEEREGKEMRKEESQSDLRDEKRVPKHMKAQKEASEPEITQEESQSELRDEKRVPKHMKTEASETKPQPSALATAVGGTKEAVSAAAARAAAQSDGAPKLAKQLGKLEALLDDVSAKADALPADDAPKVERWLGKLTQDLGSLPEDGKLSDKASDKLTDRLRSLRKKIAGKF